MAETIEFSVRLPALLHERLIARTSALGPRAMNAYIAQAIIEKLERDTTAHDNGHRFIVRDVAAPLPYVVIDRTYQFGASSFGTCTEAQRVADQWNRDYPQTPAPQPALVG